MTEGKKNEKIKKNIFSWIKRTTTSWTPPPLFKTLKTDDNSNSAGVHFTSSGRNQRIVSSDNTNTDTHIHTDPHTDIAIFLVDSKHTLHRTREDNTRTHKHITYLYTHIHIHPHNLRNYMKIGSVCVCTVLPRQCSSDDTYYFFPFANGIFGINNRENMKALSERTMVLLYTLRGENQ